MLSYVGVFFEGDDANIIRSLEKMPLGRPIDALHCTFKYHPTDAEIKEFNELVNQVVEVIITGYACDGKNSGFVIQIPDSGIRNYYISRDENGLIIPHITTSLAQGALAKDTKNLFTEAAKNLVSVKFDNPVRIKGKVGYWIKDDTQYISYEPYNKGKKRS